MVHALRIFVIIFLLILVGIGGAIIIFWWRFNANDYRLLLESEMTKRLGLETKVGHVEVAWRGGPMIQISNLRLSRGSTTAPFLTTDLFVLGFDPSTALSGKLAFKLKVTRARLYYSDAPGAEDLSMEAKELSVDWEQTISGNFLRTAGEGRILSETENDLEWRGKAHPKDGRVVFDAHFQQDALVLKGEAFPFQKSPRFQGVMILKALELPELRGSFLSGRAFGDLRLEGSGKNQKEIKKSLQGNGMLEIRDGTLKHFNLVSSILNRISLVPALSKVMVEAVPPSFQPILKDRDTPFELLQIEFLIQDEQVRVQPLVLKGNHYLIQAEGGVELEGETRLRSKLVLLEEISQYLTGRVRELSVLANPQGRIVIPFILRGRWPSLHPQPDLAYLAERLVVEGGAELVEKGLELLSQLHRSSTQ